MPDVAEWNGHVFTVSPGLIRGFTGLTVTGRSVVEEKENGGQTIVKRKSAATAQIAMTAELSAFTGCDVREEAMAFIRDASDGAQGYFYIGGKKLIACQMMLTEAQVTETEIAPDGQWVRSRVQMTMRQCTKLDSTKSTKASGTGKVIGKGNAKEVDKGKTNKAEAGRKKALNAFDRAVEAVKRARDASMKTVKTEPDPIKLFPATQILMKSMK